MKSARDWIIEKLTPAAFSTTNIGTNGLIIHRHYLPMPDARVYCVGVNRQETFGADEVDAVIRVMRDVQFIVVLPTDQIGHSAYQRAEECGICVAGFGELTRALDDDEDVAKHIDTQERYERRRLKSHWVVESLKRRGQHAYEIRRVGLRALTIVTTDVYEFTADELYNLLESYVGVDPDLIVVTNPTCRGLSTDSKTAAKQTGIGLVIFQELLNNLARWK